MRYKHIYILVVLFVVVFKHGTAQDSLSMQIFNMVYNMEYVQAENLLQHNQTSIDKLTAALLEIDLNYWENVTGVNSPNYDAFEETLEKYENETPQNIEEKGIQLIYLSYKLRYELKRYKFIDALFTQKDTKVLYDELKNNPKINKLENPDLFVIYNSMFLYFSNYLKPFGGKGKTENCQEAIAKMETLSKSDREMTTTLSRYFLGKTYLNYENEPAKALRHFSILKKMYPNNSMFPKLLQESEKSVE